MTGLEEVQASPNLEKFLSLARIIKLRFLQLMRIQVLFWKKHPKINTLLVKEWNLIHLIGFKLLVDVSESYLIEIV